MIATIVDWNALFDVILVSLVIGVGVTITASVAIYGTVRLADMRRDGRRAEELAFGALALTGVGITFAAVIIGLIVMTSK